MTTPNGRAKVEKRRRWPEPPPPVPAHPYRSSVLLHGALALVVVAVALLTGGDAAQAVGVAAAYFVLATGYSWWRFRQRLRRTASGRRPPE